jgi:hypothetical protein
MHPELPGQSREARLSPLGPSTTGNRRPFESIAEREAGKGRRIEARGNMSAKSGSSSHGNSCQEADLRGKG